MIYNLLHSAVLLALAVKAVSGFAKIYSSDPMWFHISGISSGIVVLLGIAWAIVFLRGDHLAKSPRVFKVLLPAAAVLAVIAAILSA